MCSQSLFEDAVECYLPVQLIPEDIDSNVCMSATTFADVVLEFEPLLKDTRRETPTIASTTDTSEISLFLFPRMRVSDAFCASTGSRLADSASSVERVFMGVPLPSIDL